MSDCQCYVLYNGFLSYEFSLNSEVPQSFNLGPRLFDLFINGLLLSFFYLIIAYDDETLQSDLHSGGLNHPSSELTSVGGTVPAISLLLLLLICVYCLIPVFSLIITLKFVLNPQKLLVSSRVSPSFSKIFI